MQTVYKEIRGAAPQSFTDNNTWPKNLENTDMEDNLAHPRALSIIQEVLVDIERLDPDFHGERLGL